MLKRDASKITVATLHTGTKRLAPLALLDTWSSLRLSTRLPGFDTAVDILALNLGPKSLRRRPLIGRSLLCAMTLLRRIPLTTNTVMGGRLLDWGKGDISNIFEAGAVVDAAED